MNFKKSKEVYVRAKKSNFKKQNSENKKGQTDYMS